MSRSSRRSAVASAVTAATVCARAVSRSRSSPLIRRCSADASDNSACPSPVWAAVHARVTSGSVNNSSSPSPVPAASRPSGNACPMLNARGANVAAPRPASHHSAVTVAVTRATGNTTTACATSSHNAGSEAAAFPFGLGRFPATSVPAAGPPAGERTVAIRHRSRPANQRAGARAPATTGDPPGNSHPNVPANRPPSTSTRPAAAITGAVSRYSDSTSVRRPARIRNLAPGRHRPRTPANGSAIEVPLVVTFSRAGT
jgi:hypothetical protein